MRFHQAAGRSLHRHLATTTLVLTTALAGCSGDSTTATTTDGSGGAGATSVATGTGTGTSGTGGGGGGQVCAPGSTESCYSGPAGTVRVGLCIAGTRTCAADGSGFGACAGEVLPAEESCQTPGDEDCDGSVNEEGAGCACVPGTSASCYSGPPATEGKGPCVGGQQVCDADGLGFGPCVGEVTPKDETCSTPIDDDCDGAINEEGAGCVCVPGSSAACYSGPNGTANVGVCKDGLMKCDVDGLAYGACVGDVLPTPETCNTPGDDDCDGATNEEGPGCVCVPGSSSSCYSGPPGTVNVGPCKSGIQVCTPDGTGFLPCMGEVLPAAETCNTPVDDDCDGSTNEGGAGCVCVPGSVASCYTGPGNTQGVGQCAAGTQTCNAQGTAYGACTGEILPAAETCATPGDEDCDGAVNEGCCGGYVFNQGCWYTAPALAMNCTQVCAPHGGFDAVHSQHNGNAVGQFFWPAKANGGDWMSIECSSTDNNTNWGANGQAPDPSFSHGACYVNCACAL